MEITGYDLSRAWFDFCFENPEKISPNHTALYMFCIEHCNRLGWKKKFGLPTTMAMEAIGVHSYNTYIKTLNNLIEFGFIKLVEKSKNQYSSNIIALSNFDKALDKALDKASIKHSIKHSESTVQSNYSIIKQINIEQLNIEHITILKNIIKNFEEKKSIQEEEIKKEEKKKFSFDFSNFDENFIEHVNSWLEYKKERKEPYKSQKGLNAFYNKLIDYSKNDPDTAKKIIEQSMANNWAGIFELKEAQQKNKDPFYREPIVDRTHGFSIQF
jgi:hypothetical protein